MLINFVWKIDFFFHYALESAKCSSRSCETFPTWLIHVEKLFGGWGCHFSVKAFRHNIFSGEKNKSSNIQNSSSLKLSRPCLKGLEI